MYVVIFKARINQFDDEYSKMAQKMRDLALTECGCLEFNAVTEGDQELALSYWPTEEHIRAWKKHPEHIAAQQLGKERWYESYSVEVVEIKRSYKSA